MTGAGARWPTRDELLADLDSLWSELLPRLDAAACGDVQLELGVWTLAQVYGHVGRWSQTAATQIDRHVAGLPRLEDYHNWRKWNDRWARQDAGLSVDDGRAIAIAGHEALRARIASIPDERWGQHVVAWAIGAGTDHYRDHLATPSRVGRRSWP